MIQFFKWLFIKHPCEVWDGYHDMLFMEHCYHVIKTNRVNPHGPHVTVDDTEYISVEKLKCCRCGEMNERKTK